MTEYMERKSSYTAEELIAGGDGAGFGPEYAHLPVPPMLMMDRITLVSNEGGAYDRGQVVAELDIHPGLWFFQCHFVDDPVMPGCLGLDALWQLLGFYLAWRGHKGQGRALGVKEVKFRGEIVPTSKKVRYVLDIRKVIAGKLALAQADGTVFVDDKEVYKTLGLSVGLFNPAQRQRDDQQ